VHLGSILGLEWSLGGINKEMELEMKLFEQKLNYSSLCL
jgi:hypothetical protein